MDVSGEIFSRIEQPQKPIPVHSRRWFAGPITRPNLFVPGAFVERSDCLFDLGVLDDEKPPPLHISVAWSADTGLQNLADQPIWHRVWLQSPHRPGGPHDLEQIDCVWNFLWHSVLADVRSIRVKAETGV